MNKVVGEVTVTQEQILHGDHHIVTGGAVPDGTAAFKAGTVLYENAGAYVPLAKTDAEHEPCAVAVEALTEAADEAVIPVCVHGAVRAEKLCFADESGITQEVAAKLRASGIYAIAGEGFTGWAEAAASGSGD